MELRDYLVILRKNWLLIIAFTLLGVGAAAGYTLTVTPLYSAETTVFVSSESASSVSELSQGNTYTLSRVTTYAELVSTPSVLEPVIASLGLDVTSDDLASRVSASASTSTTLITITAQDADAVTAADIANAAGSSLASVVEEIETPTTNESSPVRLTVVEKATAAFSPSTPNVKLNLALGGLVGLALGLGLAVLRSTLDTRVRTESDLAEVTEVPLIGGIPFEVKFATHPLIVHSDPHSPRAEAFRSLRTNLQFVSVGDHNSVVVTSSSQSEGKSTTAVNLALAVADTGARVALVDADLRRSKVASYMDIEGGVGLSDLLIGRASLGDVMQHWGRGGLYVLPAGRIPPNPSELLGSDAMKSLIAYLEKEFDFVIFDAPPLLPVTDAAVLAGGTGGALLVVAAGRTSRQQLSGALDALNLLDAHVMGIVLSMVPTKGPDAYGYGRYGYGYGGYYTRDAGGKNARARSRDGSRGGVPATSTRS